MKKILLLSGLIVSSVGLFAFIGDKSGSLPLKDQKVWVEATPESNSSAMIAVPSLAPLVTRIKPAVLVVSTESISTRNQQLPPGYEDLYRFFGPGAGNPNFRQPEQNRKGLGSGFIIHPSGLALTNNHVIEGATKIKIKVGGDLKEYEAEVVGTDPDTDVALIQIKSDKKDWPTLPLGSSSTRQVGDFAMAIGNPLGLEHSISFGPISARGRRDIQPSGKRGLFDFMQLSAPINPGNSGGALVNMSGEVIGINTAISTSGQGIAFAIPIDQVKQILPQLRKNGKVSRSGLGVRIENVSPELAKELGLPYAHGALVREVVSGSAAAKAGIQPGDVITEFDGKILNDASALSVETGLAGVGKSVILKISRDNQSLTLRITLEALEKESPIKKSDLKELESLGLQVVDPQDLNIQGARIVEVSPYSVANMAGLEKDDVVLKVNNQLIKNADALASLVKKTPSGALLRILLKRQNSSFFVVIQKP